MANGNTQLFMGQLIFMEMAELAEAAEQRVLAKIALAGAAEKVATPATVEELLALPWDQYHASIALLALAINTPLQWKERHLTLLRRWSGEQGALS